MARDYDSQRERTDGQTVAGTTPVAEGSATGDTQFLATGPIPAVETAGGAPGPTASELAFGPEPGPGLKALDALLAAGKPKPDPIVDLLDAHRGETAAIMARLEAKLGAAFVQEVRDAMGLRASIKRREIVAGDPTDPTGGHFIASAEEKGARWRTADGDFTGKVDKQGLDSTYRLDEDDALHARAGKGGGTLAWERDGKSMGELYGATGGGVSDFGLRRSWDLDGGGQLTGGLRHRVQGGLATDGAFGQYRSADGLTTTEAALGVQGGQPAGSLGVTHKPTDRDTYFGEVGYDTRGTRLIGGGTHGLDGGRSVSGRAELLQGPGGTTGLLAGSYTEPRRTIDGSIARTADQTLLHAGVTERMSPELTLSGSLDHAIRDQGQDQTTLRLSERYRSPRLVHGLDLEAGRGERDYLSATGSMDAQLGDRLYGGAFGSARYEQGKQLEARIGASLTFTTTEKTALTLAGVLDQSGTLETRLQYDVFKSRISGVGDIADHKKDALLSLFVSYTQRPGGQRMLDDRFGAPQMGTGGDSQVMAGIRIKF